MNNPFHLLGVLLSGSVAFGFELLALSFLACQQDVSFDTLETARNQARENAVWNAQRFRMTDPRFAGLEIISRGDSTQSPECPQGDGWASIDFILRDKSGFLSTKCSTVSSAVGCMTSDDFKGKSYAQEENHCAPNTKVPFPFRKIVE